MSLCGPGRLGSGKVRGSDIFGCWKWLVNASHTVRHDFAAGVLTGTVPDDRDSPRGGTTGPVDDVLRATGGLGPGSSRAVS
jgi:hypothetical protein